MTNTLKESSQSKKEGRSFILPGQVISALWFISLFTIIPHILYLIWPAFMQLCIGLTVRFGGSQKLWMYIIIANVTNLIVLSSINLSMWWVYVVKKPFFEQFRIDPNVEYSHNIEAMAMGRKKPKDPLEEVFGSDHIRRAVQFFCCQHFYPICRISSP